MRSVTVLYTGGTIGMVPGPDGLGPDTGFEAAFRAALPTAQFDWIDMPKLLDSSLMGPADWVAIADILRDISGGIVVLHGTDTMAYTAAALSFLLRELDAPVVLTGSQIPMQSEASDALTNVTLALDVAANSPRAEVMIAFGGVVLRGNRAVKQHAQEFVAFGSPNHPALDWRAAQVYSRELAGDWIAPVGVLKVYPGIGAEAVCGFAHLPGLVIEAFGSGNMPGEGTAFHHALKQSRDAGQEIVVVTQCGAGHVAAATYAAGASVGALGLIAGGDMVTSAAVVKLGWLLAQGLRGEPLAQAMMSPVVGEVSA